MRQMYFVGDVALDQELVRVDESESDKLPENPGSRAVNILDPVQYGIHRTLLH